MPLKKKRKLGPKTIDYVFLVYVIHSVTVGYRFLIINSSHLYFASFYVPMEEATHVRLM